MNTLGKILVFFVLILSLIWNYLVVNAYATRTNYKAALVDAQKLYAEAAKSADSFKKQLEEQKSASDAVVAQHQATIRDLEGRLKNSTDALAKVNDDLEKLVADKQKQSQNAGLLQSEITTKQAQIDIQREQYNNLNVKLNDATISEQKATNEALSAKIERDAERRKSENYEKDIINLTEQAQNAARGGTGGVGSTRIPPTDPDFRASVKNVEGSIVEISLGSNANLQKGAVLDLSRPNARKYIGKLVIERVDPFSATGRFVPLASVSKPSDEDFPKKNDLVSVVK
jgi:hypothetical protein